MRTGERGFRLLTLVAALVFVVGLGTAGAAPAPAARALAAVPSAPAVAAPAAAGDDQAAATLADDAFHHCLASDYDGNVTMRPCAPGQDDHFAQWQGVGHTLVDVQTGLCLDGNDRGDIYTRPCDPAGRNPYQEWRRNTQERAIFNPTTQRALSADDTGAVGGAYLGLDRQHWTVTNVSGPCAIEPLTLVVDKVLPEEWDYIAPLPPARSPEGLGGHWKWSVQIAQGTTSSATTTNHMGLEFSYEALKASASRDLAEQTSTSITVTVTADFDRVVPAGEQMIAVYGVHKRHLVYHWHRVAKDCTDLDSGPYDMVLPYAQEFAWNCERALDPDCKQKIEAANAGPGSNGVRMTAAGSDGVRMAAAGSDGVRMTGSGGSDGVRTVVAGDGTRAAGPYAPNVRPASAEQVRAAPDAGPLYVYEPTLKATTGGAPNPPPAEPKPTRVAYTGPRSADYHVPFVASARVTSGGAPVPAGRVEFTLGSASCGTTVDTSGAAACQLTPRDRPGRTTLRVRYSGTQDYAASSADVPFTVNKEPTNLAYTGTTHLANGEPARLAARLTEGEVGRGPIRGRGVRLALGAGASEQACTATTDADGTAACTVPSVGQPLTDAATVPVSADFAGDAYYLGSHDTATARLQYYTGRATGLTAAVRLPLLSLNAGPTPDTGLIRTATATRTATPCAAAAGVLLVHADALCPSVVTTLSPGTVRAEARLQSVRIGLPGLPLIELSGITATSTSTCESAHGSATLTLTVAGRPIPVPARPNTTLGLPHGLRLTLDEQSPTPDADTGLTVTAAHLVLPAPAAAAPVDITIASATSAAHNCH
ncbi:choice-of-anchor P family protein [Actinacidiphila acididurans]|uniref:choice-of-anchor P family protein n=1 Tax=Actinacidiphila acididurans TaxID=2784346 RepID=UPI0027DE53AF|nr:choice-of-anchor P family protein [Actinacidiphila acididurans]